MTIDELIELLKNGGYLTNREEKQIAEWLELLKWYEQGMEDIPSESGVLPKDVYSAGYNKAIDDAKSVILQTLDNEILVDTLHLRLEQLKEQKKTCFDCKNHFMSDCYLECYKHERINNDSICDDFE